MIYVGFEDKLRSSETKAISVTFRAITSAKTTHLAEQTHTSLRIHAGGSKDLKNNSV